MSTLYIDRQGSQLQIQAGVLHITTPEGQADRRLPVKYLDRIVLRTDTQLSSKVLYDLADHGVNLIALSGRGGQKMAQMTGTPHNDARRRWQQVLTLSQPQLCAQVAHGIVMSKVKRQRATLTGIAAQRPDLRKPLHDGQKRLSGILGTLSGAESSTHTFGGGTVLMLRYRHRMSKDVDIFVPDPQYLGFVSPRLSDVAEAIASRYVEGPGYVKLLRPEGEIDFVASANLTNDPFEVWDLLGRQVRVETSAEIVAKKLWHRGERATARDLFDLALVIARDPLLLATASPFLKRHREPFLKQVQDRKGVLKVQFEAIDTLEYRPSYALAVELVSEFLWSLE